MFHWVNWLKPFKHNWAGLTPRTPLVNHWGVTMSQGSRFTIDIRLVHLFEKLAALNPPVGQMVAALNVVLAENGETIVTKVDFEQFLEQLEEWE